MLYEKLVTAHLSEEKCVLTDGERKWTYREIDEQCGRIAQAMRNRGVDRQDRVFILAEHTIAAILMVLSCIRLGACAVPIPKHVSKSDLKTLIADAEPKLVIDNKPGRAEGAVSYSGLLDEAAHAAVCHIVHTAPSDLAYILYTSGSTGSPKGVMAPEKQVIFCIDAINRRLGNCPEDRILDSLPLSFDYGLYQAFLSLSAKSCLVLPPDAPIQQIVSWLHRAGITGFPAMPAMLNMLLKTGLLEKAPLPELRYITSTGDMLPVELIAQVSRVLPHAEIIPMYGLTECKRVAIMPHDRRDKTAVGSCGLPLDGTAVWLDEPDKHGVGELIVAGDNVMAGYWKDSDTTAQYFFHDEIHGNCLRSGDLFRIDEEGFLYFCGRKKRILKVNGYRIGIPELENKILSHMGGMIEELRIVGLHDSVIGDKIVVCIYSNFSEQALAERLRAVSSTLSPYQRPHALCRIPKPLPKNDNGKIDEAKLKDELSNYACIKLWHI